MIIRDVRLEDAERLLEIYSYYVTDTAITFEYDVPSLDEFTERIKNISSKYPYIVLEDEGKIYGYSYAGSFKARAAYDKSCELTIYLDKDSKKRGYGKALYQALEKKLFDKGIENLYACIGDPIVEDQYLTKNSEQFHSHLGFVKIGSFFKCGYKFGNWYNMIWMEKFIGNHNLKTETIELWLHDEYKYSSKIDSMPNLMSFLHDDGLKHSCMIVVPESRNGALSIDEAEIVAKDFYKLGYNTFVLVYTNNDHIEEALLNQQLKDFSRAIRLIRKNSDKYGVLQDKIGICGFSDGAHLCGSLGAQYEDIEEVNKELCKYSNKPDVAILGCQDITNGKYEVNDKTPPTFLWNINNDRASVENTYLYDNALSNSGIQHEVHVFSQGHLRLENCEKGWTNSKKNLWQMLADSFVTEVLK